MIENESLRHLAEAVFKENGELHITGQGTLRRVFLSAHLSEDDQKIYPPEEHCFFHKNTHTNTDASLVEKVGVFYILTDEEAKKRIREWENWLIKEAARRPVRFGDFGSFSFGDVLEFTPESLLFYKWLPVLDYKKVYDSARDLPGKNLVRPMDLERDHDTNLKQKKTFQRSAGKYVMGVVLLLLFLFSFPYWLEPVNALMDGGATINRKLVNVAPDGYDYPVDLERYSDTEMTTKEEMVLDENHENIVSAAGDENEKEGEDEETAEEHKIYADADASRPVSSDVERPEPRCTLIVGGFAESGNIERMIHSLEEMDLETVTLKRKTITLVGAKVDCNQRAKIEEIKEVIEPSAWIYHQ